jgi:hypothetical protein
MNGIETFRSKRALHAPPHLDRLGVRDREGSGTRARVSGCVIVRTLVRLESPVQTINH